MKVDSLIAGTATLGRLNSSRAILIMLEEILSRGIGTLDTAPLYAAGCMERLIGQVRNRYPELKVNTKFGLLPAMNLSWLKPFYLASKVTQSLFGKISRPSQHDYSLENITKAASTSLSQSIRLLGGNIDVFFAHEIPWKVLESEDFLSFIQRSKQVGLFRRFGLGGYRYQYETTEGSRLLWNEVDVVQVESVPARAVQVPDFWKGEIFLHGVVSPIFRTFPRISVNPESLEERISDCFIRQKANRIVVGFSKVPHLTGFLNSFTKVN